MIPSTSPPPDIREYFIALGRLVVAFSDLENEIKAFANYMINTQDDTGQILTSDMPSKPLLHKLISLYRHHENDPGKIEAFELLAKRIEKLTQARNDMIHGFWFTLPLMDDDPPIRVIGKARFKGFHVEQRHIPISEISILVKGIAEATSELNAISFHWAIDHDIPRVTDETDEQAEP